MKLASTQQTQAFTLLEVLIAVAIFAVLLASINGLFYGAMHLQVRNTTAIDEQLPIDNAAGIIKKDIAGVVLPNGVLAGPMSGGLSSSTAAQIPGIKGIINLELYTTTGVIDDELPRGDIQKVDYSLENATNGVRNAGKDLVRSITRNLLATAPEVPDQQRLISNVEKLKVTFFDGTNWLETWGSTGETNSTVPTAIRLELTLLRERNQRDQNPPIEFLFPVGVTLPTNTTITGS